MSLRFADNSRGASLLVLLPAFAACLRAETIELQFAPPSGQTQTVVSRSTRTVYRDGNEQKDVSESKYRMTAEKRDQGYRVVKHIISTTLNRNGHNVASPMLDAMEGLEIVYSVDSDGQVKSIHGYDGILVNLKSKFPPALMQTLAPLFNEQSIRAQDVAEWKTRVGQYAGKKVELGDVWTTTETATLPAGGRAEFQKATVFEGWVDCGGGRCLRIKVFYHSDPGKLAERVSEVSAKEIGPFPTENQESSAASADVMGEGERIVDPNTLRVYSERITRTIVAGTPNSGDSETLVKVVETREYTSETEPSE